MTSLQTSKKRTKSAKDIEQERKFIAQHGDLRLAPSLQQRGRQFFDSADWSMFKHDLEKELKISSLPHKTKATRSKISSTRKSLFAGDSARSTFSTCQEIKTSSSSTSSSYSPCSKASE